MSFFKHCFHLASKQIAYLVIILVAVLMIAAGALYWLSDAVEQRQDEIAVWVSKQLGYPVEIGSAGVHLLGLMPKLQVNRVNVLSADKSREIISIESLYLGLDVIASIAQSKVVLNDLTLTGVHLAIERNALGAFQLQGIDNTNQPAVSNDRDWLMWINVLNRSQMQAVTIDYTDQQNKALSGVYFMTHWMLTHEAEQWATSGHLRLASNLGAGAGVQFSTQWRYEQSERLLGPWKMETTVTQVALAPLATSLIWQDIGLQEGTVTATILASGRGKYVDTAHITVDLAETKLVSKQEGVLTKPVVLEQLKGQIDWQQQDKTWQLSGRDIQLQMNGDKWPNTGFTIKKQHDKTWIVASNYLRLSDITAVALLSSQSPEIIRQQQPAGDVERLTVQYSAGKGVSELAFSLRDGVMLPWNNYPGVTGLTAEVNWQADVASLKLNSHQLTVYAEKWLDDAVFFDSVSGELTLQRQNQVWTLNSNALRVWNDDLTLQIDGSVHHTSDGKIINDLQLTMEEVSINRWQAYVPQKILSKSFKHWSKNAFVAGKIIDGKIELKGELAAFPYEAEPEKGQFKLALQLEDVQLHYGRQWPDLIGVNGSLTGSGNDLIINSKQGKIAGFNFTGVMTTITQLVESKPILRLDGELTGTTANAMTFLQNSPLKERFGKVAKATKAQGVSKINLHLMVPLADVDAAQVSGSVSFDNSQLQSKAFPALVLSKVKGKLNFSNNGVTAKAIKASVFDAPVSINVLPKGEATIVSVKGGHVSTQQIEIRWPNTVPKFISGKTAYEVNVSISEKSIGDFIVDAAIQSNLKGIAINLPEPFAKTSTDIKHVRAAIKQIDNEYVYSVDYDKLLSIVVAPDDKRWRGEVNVGAGQAKLPNHGVKLRGQLAELSLDKWYEWSKQFAGKGDNLLVASMDDTFVSIGTLSGFNQQFTGLTLSAKKDAQGWRAQIKSKETTGTIYWPDDFTSDATLKVDVDKLKIVLPKLDRKNKNNKQITEKQAKSLWPTMDIAIGSLGVNDLVLGKLQLRGHRTSDAWLLDKGSLISNDFKASILKGEWRTTATGSRSHVKIQANSDDLAGLLASFDYQQAIEAEKVEVIADLSWPNTPLAASTDLLKGSLNIDIGKGKLNDIEPGAAGRIFGLMSIAALPRRLSLDFNDLFSKGFYFDSIRGTFKFANGQAVTDDFVLKGTSAKIEMSGAVDLIHQQYDQKVKVTPNVSSTLPLAGAVAGGPIGLGVGTALLLVDKLAGVLFDKNIVNLISYRYHLTGPWESPELTVAKPAE